jgi:AcrR family transcriptional regulator
MLSRPPGVDVGPSRRDAVRDAALSLFAERGYAGTTVNLIAERLGIRGPSIYNHVSSKQQLLVDIVLDFIEGGVVQQAEVIAAASDPVQQLRAAVDLHVRTHTRFRREAFVSNREIRSLEEPNRSRVIAARDRYAHAFTEIIEAGVSAGRFDCSDPALTSIAIVQMGIGVATWYRSDGRLSVDEISEYHQDLALRMVGAGP